MLSSSTDDGGQGVGRPDRIRKLVADSGLDGPLGVIAQDQGDRLFDVESGRRQVVYRSADQPFEAPNWTTDGGSLIYNTWALRNGVRPTDLPIAVLKTSVNLLSPDGDELKRLGEEIRAAARIAGRDVIAIIADMSAAE